MPANSALTGLGSAGGGAIGGLLPAFGGYPSMAICLPVFTMLAAGALI